MPILTRDLSVFIGTIYGGIIIGLLFDVHRALKLNFKLVKHLSIVFDMMFWTLVTFITFITVNAIENFDLRYYHFVALFIGFILYYNTISKFILAAINKVISLVTNLLKKTLYCMLSILNNLYYVIIYSLHFIFDIIFYIPNMLTATTRFIRRKYRKGLKIKKRV
ncbi:hypothetical protein CHL78_012410 [Romboutsia weinsteinii]|uniref:Spore cortex biosynthesis protein YabQ n=1 Tax=Romboutsia weinsteinii TaxID=2020949 RepID=A0A371J1F9_9FIRM|nr:hypothetical protein CHL78_012410 [Romboutsia weinsteinii]